MADAVFDSCILIDYLLGIEAARETIAHSEAPAISIVSWMETLVGAADEDEEAAIHRFLERFERIGVTEAVAERAVALRRAHRLSLPDAIVWATAKAAGRPLLTRNTRDFPADAPDIVAPYRM